MARRGATERRFPPMPSFDALCAWADGEGGFVEIEADAKTGTMCIAVDVPTIPGGGLSRYLYEGEDLDHCAKVMMTAITKG